MPRSIEKMPKGKSNKSGKGSSRKGTPGLRNPRRGGALSDDESLNGDAASILSLNSDRGSYDDVGDNGNEGLEHEDGVVQSRETLEEKIAEAIDALTEKSANARVGGLNTLTTILSQQFVPELVLGRRETLRDNLEKIFKRRNERNEQGMAATLASLAALQVGSFDLDTATDDFSVLKPMFQQILLDYTVPVAIRVKCCQALSLGAFLAESSLDDVCTLLGILEPLFGLKSKRSTNSSGEDETEVETIDVSTSLTKAVKIPKTSCGTLASAAISSWSLLITLMPPEYLKPKCLKWTQILLGLLEQSDLEVRLNAGEALAVLVEVCDLYLDPEDADDDDSDHGVPEDEVLTNGHNSNGASNGHHGFGYDRVNVKALIRKLKELSTESHKYRAKRDRRQQRHSFRDYLHAVQNGDGPGQSIKFGSGESLEIDTWVKKRHYEAICQVVGSGINRHLVENILVRQILELGAPKPIVTDGFSTRQAKSERQYLNAVNFKARCVSRGKSRDQRMANLADF